MPKLKGMDSKVLFGKQVDKENDDVFYSDKEHIYMSKKDGAPYISVTQLIHRYTQPFDANFWSSYKAAEALLGAAFSPLKSKLLTNKLWKDSYLEEYGIDKSEFENKKKEILQSYADTNREACEHGTEVHAKMENLFYQKDEKRLSTFGIGGKIDVEKGYYKFDKERAIYPEILLSYAPDEYLRISGQADIVIKDGDEFTIGDWKTSKSIDKESYFDKSKKKRQMLKFPLDNIQDSNFWIYSLQLSLYMYMIQQMNPKYKCKKLVLIHIDRDGNETEYECQYLKEDIARMLYHYRRENKMKMELDKDKPIVF